VASATAGFVARHGGGADARVERRIALMFDCLTSQPGFKRSLYARDHARLSRRTSRRLHADFVQLQGARGRTSAAHSHCTDERCITMRTANPERSELSGLQTGCWPATRDAVAVRENLRGGGALLGHHRWAVSFHGLGVRDEMRWPAAPRRTLTPAQIDTVRVVRSGRPRFARMLRKIAATHAPLRREASRFARPLARALCDAGARQTPGRLGVALAQKFLVGRRGTLQLAADRSIGCGLRRVATVSARRGGLEAALATAARAGLEADDRRRTDLALSPPGATALGPWRLAVRSALFLQQKFDFKSFFF